MCLWIEVRKLTSQPLSISEVLRFANHDFMNQLQLIKMNLDLGRVEEAKKIIENLSERSKNFSDISKLRLPKTVEWLQTVQWRFPAFEISIDCNAKASTESEVDEQVANYLEKTIIHVYDQLDPFIEQILLLEIKSDNELFQVIFDLKGKWDAEQFRHQDVAKIKVHTIEQSNNSWKYVLTIEQE